MTEPRLLTGTEAGLSGDEQIRISLRAIIANGGTAQIIDCYKAVEQHMNGAKLSDQGKASLRFFINKVAVKAGYVYPANPSLPGWRITPEGREAVTDDSIAQEEAVNVDTTQSIQVPSNSARGAAFELYVLQLLKYLYPYYTWYHQGQHKNRERGLDFIGSQIGQGESRPQFIGVQVKFHAISTAPSALEWSKFLAGCFARRIDQAVFITTGRLTSEQRREAGEARVVVIEGRNEILRIAKLYNIEEFELFEEKNHEDMGSKAQG